LVISETTWSIINPVISSNIAALVRTVPTSVLASPALDRMVRVVPREVAESEAPAVKLCKSDAPKGISKKDRTIGKIIPVTAIRRETKDDEMRLDSEVDSPPIERDQH
jgi:hypothetical protein